MLNIFAVCRDVEDGGGSLGWGWHHQAGLCLHSASCRGAASPAASSLRADHRLWSGVPLHPRLGFHEGRVKEDVPKGSHTAQKPLQGTEGPKALLKSCLSAGVWASLEGGGSPAQG